MPKAVGVGMPNTNYTLSRRCHADPDPACRRHGFTLVELLVVIAILGVLVALLMPALSSVRASARRIECGSRMRQVGLGIHAFAEANRGQFPKVAGHGADSDESWIYRLAPYLEQSNAIRTCPDDPLADEHIANFGTSFALNGYLAIEDEDGHHEAEEGHEHEHEEGDDHEHDDDDHDHGDEHEHDDHDHRVFRYLSKLRSASSTIVLVEAAAGAHGDHVESFEWFSDEKTADEIYQAVIAQIAVERHAGVSANYLFADNHVESLDAQQIRLWCAEGKEHKNFMHPR